MIVLWTANTERFCDVEAGLNDTAENLLQSIRSNAEEVSPSTLFAVASVLEGVREGGREGEGREGGRERFGDLEGGGGEKGRVDTCSAMLQVQMNNS